MPLVDKLTRFARFCLLTLGSAGGLLGPALMSAGQAADSAVADTAGVATTWQQRLRSDVGYLASEELAGRSSTEPEIHKAARFVAERFRESGLDTAVFGDSPMQRLEIPAGVRLAAPNMMTLARRGNDDRVCRVGRDFTPMAIGAPQAKVDAEVVFVGYGIRTGEFDEYANVDCQGKAVMVIRKTPGVNRGEAEAGDKADRDTNPASAKSVFGNSGQIREAFFITKIRQALNAGAACVLLVNDNSSTEAAVAAVDKRIEVERVSVKQLRDQRDELPVEAKQVRAGIEKRLARSDEMMVGLQDERTQAARGMIGMTEAGVRPLTKRSIPVIALSRETASEILVAAGGKTLAQFERQIFNTRAPASLPLDAVRLKAETNLSKSNTATDNVIGVLDGKGDLADQTVVIGAHYDHVGMGKYGSLAGGTIAVHNGADDNASGTATLIATADQLVDQMRGVEHHRRIVVIAFTAEERGLLGSKFYTRNPRFPLDRTVAMINLDMVGRLRDNELTVYGLGTADCLEGIVDRANSDAAFTLFKQQSGYGPSDHQSFSEVNVPVLFFFTGLHTDYHRPSDDVERLNFPAMEKIVDVVAKSSRALATRAERPVHRDTAREITIRRQMTAFLGVSMNPSLVETVVSGVTPSSPAQRGGIQVGDQIVLIAGETVTNPAEVRELLRRRSPGERVELQVIRGNTTVTLSVRLGRRPG